MTRIQNPNLEILALAVEKLGELVDEFVFLGGCATGLLITDPAAPPARVTRDVDAIVQVFSLADYYQLSERLRTCGFKGDTSEDAPICRWVTDSIVLDVMPTDSRILGFGNQWYLPAMEKAKLIQLSTGNDIRMVSAPYFLITKLEAFEGRGGGDYLMSHDIEDIVTVLDGRPEIIEEVKQSDFELTSELSNRFTVMLEDNRFIDSVSGHLLPDDTSQARTSIILERIEAIVENRG